MKRLISRIFLLTGLFFMGLSGWAQTASDDVVFQATQDELKRNYENLKLENYGKPFFLSYTLNVYARFEVVGSLGAIKNAYIQPQSATGTVRLMTGDHHRTNEFTYDAQGLGGSMPAEMEYNELRRNLWMATDIAYKNALQQYGSKAAFLRSNPKSEEEEAVDDFTKQAVTNHIVEGTSPKFDEELWKTNIKKLSALFKKYPKLQNSQVVIGGIQSIIYKVTSEGLKIRVPQSQFTLSAMASVIAKDGVRISDSWSMTMAASDEFPAIAELEKKVDEFAQGLMRLSEVEPIQEFYSGPILFEDNACFQVLHNNLLQSGYLLAWRRPEGKQSRFTFDGRMERKILDSRLTVKNCTGLKTYNGKNLYGTYDVDAEGIAPAKELVLIENGILRKQLNGRIPSLKAPLSTGSSRFEITSAAPSFMTAPATIHVSVKDGLKADKMKKALLKAAAEENLSYAYIVRKMAGQASLIYKVDTKTGEESQVRAGDFAELNLAKLKRLREVSMKENVSNYTFERKALCSMIYPSAILMDDVEINVPQLKKEKKPVLTFPLER